MNETPFGPTISIERPYQKKGAPSCGLYLIAPKKLQLNLFMVQARSAFTALNNSPYERNMHALELRFPAKIYETEREQASVLVDVCKRNGIVAIIRDNIGLCVECNADGVILEDAQQVAQARHILGENAIIGLDCKNSSAQADAALAAPVDYVMFSKFFALATSKQSAELDLLSAWSDKTQLPAAAVGNLSVERCMALVRAGAGFIGASSWVWNHKEGPARAVYWLQAAIERALADSPALN